MAADTYKIGSAITTIQNLADEPTESAAQLKAKFDLGAETVRLQHDLLCDYADATLATKTELAAAVLSGILDDSITNAKMDTDVKIGSLAALTTTDKDSITDAINEIKTDVTALNTNNGSSYYGKYSQMSGGNSRTGKAQAGAITFSAEDNDDFTTIDETNWTKLIIPAALNGKKAKFYWSGSISPSGKGSCGVALYKNGVSVTTMMFAYGNNSGTVVPASGKAETIPVVLATDDYFEARFYPDNMVDDTTSSVSAGSIFGMEVLG